MFAIAAISSRQTIVNKYLQNNKGVNWNGLTVDDFVVVVFVVGFVVEAKLRTVQEQQSKWRRRVKVNFKSGGISIPTICDVTSLSHFSSQALYLGGVGALFSLPSDNKNESLTTKQKIVFDANACERWVLKEEMGSEKSDEDMELPQATERFIPLESERAKMLNMGPDDVAQPVTVPEEKCLPRALLISADEM
ncbi:splicing factor 3B subunit 2 [Trichonephila clavipes]|nr:splicing factor 3B subunit 2 [Trichonephila clavipes]